MFVAIGGMMITYEIVWEYEGREYVLRRFRFKDRAINTFTDCAPQVEKANLGRLRLDEIVNAA